MECPKCNGIIDDNATVCPHCHKVIALQCPNCGVISDTSVCSKCGYTILVKCAKCSKIGPVINENCSKCGFSLKTSLAYQECDSDELASIIVKFGSLQKIKATLKSQELYSKFLYKLKNLLVAQLKGFDCKLISYNDDYVINMNKELSLATSSNKAIRLALKIVNAFVDLNINIQEELGIPLDLNLTLIKKDSEALQDYISLDTSVKLLTIKKGIKKYLRGFQIVMDHFIWEEILKDYKTDSLYSIELDGQQLMIYEIILDSYVLPPSEKNDDNNSLAQQTVIKQEVLQDDKDNYSFKVFDINAKCSFERGNAIEILTKLKEIDFSVGGKIISLKSSKSLALPTNSIIETLNDSECRVLKVRCSQLMNYRPWGVFVEIFKEYYRLPFCNKFFELDKIDSNSLTKFKSLFDLIFFKPVKALTPEDARFNYMEAWGIFLSKLKKTIILIEDVEYIDDTSLQTLELYFDKFKNVIPSFVFIDKDDGRLHTKIKSLLRTDTYIEYTLTKTPLELCLSTLKGDLTDFIQSFYYEKIKSNFRGSYLYFTNAISYLKENDVLIYFDEKYIVKDKKSIVIPNDFKGLIKARIKNLSRNQENSLILAYTGLLGGRVDLKTLEQLGVNEVLENLKKLVDSGLIDFSDNIVSLNNCKELREVISNLLKKDAKQFLAKNILMQISKGLDDTTLANSMGMLVAYKEEYLTYWKNAQFAINVGDYDAYLKNCLSFLALVDKIGTDISNEDIDANKKDVYNNILMFLYAYSPAKIYYIENILLMDAIKEKSDEKIVKLSNLMLQGALLTSNYTDALGLLHNILLRMPNPTMYVDGVVNTKFLLLLLVNVEILYNIGDFRQCVEVMNEILAVLKPDILEKIKPASFSINLFINHILETCRLVGIAKIFLLDDDIDTYFECIKNALGTELPEKDCILAIKEFFAGKSFSINNVEDYSAYSKVIFLILQEFVLLDNDYKKFAQNIYQAKLLAIDIHQKELEYLCDLLIAYAYSLAGVNEKSMLIYEDVSEKSQKSAIFNIILLVNYLRAALLIKISKKEEALNLINDSLALIRKYENQAKIFFVLFEQLYIKTVQDGTLVPCDIEAEKMKIEPYKIALKKLVE